MKIIKKIFPFVFLLILSYWAIQPFFVSGFFPMHDDTQVARVFEMHKSLADGMFPVRWVADLGYNYGYPIFNFYGPFAYYIGGFFNFFTDALIATKLMMVFGILAAGFFMYLFAKEFWGKLGGILAAILYIYAPYHGVNVYVRGAVSEFWAYAFIPLVFYGLWKTYKERAWKYVVIGSFGYAGVVTSHNLTAMMVTPFVLVVAFLLYIFARREKKLHKPFYPVLVLLIGILLSGFYWLPVLTEMQYTNVLSQVGGTANYKDHFVCFGQLWNSPWAYGGSTETCVDGLSYKIGKLHILFGIISFFVLPLFWKKDKKLFLVLSFMVLSLFGSIFLMLKPSQFIWDAIAQMAFFQYPWRFLGLTAFFISFLGGAVIFLAQKRLPSQVFVYPLFFIILTATIYFNAEAFVPQTRLSKTVADYTKFSAIAWTASSLTDEYLPKDFMKPIFATQVPKRKIDPQQGIKIVSLKERSNQIDATIDVEKTVEVLVNHAYFPVWHVFIDEKQSDFKYFNKGLLINVPQGKHDISIRYSETLIEKIANGLSVTGVLVIIIGIIMQQKKKKYGKKST